MLLDLSSNSFILGTPGKFPLMLCGFSFFFFCVAFHHCHNAHIYRYVYAYFKYIFLDIHRKDLLNEAY